MGGPLPENQRGPGPHALGDNIKLRHIYQAFTIIFATIYTYIKLNLISLNDNTSMSGTDFEKKRSVSQLRLSVFAKKQPRLSEPSDEGPRLSPQSDNSNPNMLVST